MALMILFGCLAFWGALSLVWVLLGWLLPKAPVMLLHLCPEKAHPDGAIARYVWLHSLGLLHGPLMVIGRIPENEQRIWTEKYSNLKFLTPEELISRLELERTT